MLLNSNNVILIIFYVLYMFLTLTDVTFAEEDTNSILADYTNRTIPGNAMQVVPTGDQIWIRCKWRHLMPRFVTCVKWRHLVAKFVAYASGAT